MTGIYDGCGWWWYSYDPAPSFEVCGLPEGHTGPHNCELCGKISDEARPPPRRMPGATIEP